MSKNSTHENLATLLLSLEGALRQASLWQESAPAPEALLSTQPFCIDTLTFPQWLQFIFLPRMRWIVEQGDALPAKCGIAPMAEEYFRPLPVSGETVVRVLIEIDECLMAQE